MFILSQWEMINANCWWKVPNILMAWSMTSWRWHLPAETMREDRRVMSYEWRQLVQLLILRGRSIFFCSKMQMEQAVCADYCANIIFILYFTTLKKIRVLLFYPLQTPQGGWSFRVQICRKAGSPKVTYPPSKYLHGRCKILV